MTEASSLFATHPVTHLYSVATNASSASPLLNGTLSDTNVPDEEEYTIKCICIYTDDDGNTVYCEKCDTWQHIECYYHGKKVPDVHFCADCFPRELDAKKATERQRRAREQIESGDRKIKRPSSKAQKKTKKDIPASEQTNGWINHERHESVSNSRDHPPPAKKPKTSHRVSGSVASVNGESRKRAYSNVQSYPSPSKSPQEQYRFPAIPIYTSNFLELYDNDDGRARVEGNEHTIRVLPLVSRWKNDPSLIVNGTEQQPDTKAPFVQTTDDLDHFVWPSVSVETHKSTDLEYQGRVPTWKYLRLQTDVGKNALVGEIKGQVGTLDEYCHQPSCPNRWSELLHPDPFVFFHPHMNIYIDSRRSGTQFRYLRRSCNPNVTLRTFVTAGGEQHHCFVANKDIPAGSELTAAWYLNPSMFDNNNGRDDMEQQQSQLRSWISKVLANFGDCACEHTNCPWDKLDQRSSSKLPDPPTKQQTGRKKKGRAKHTVSPLSTGQATNSRAGSETVKCQDEDDDRHSTSGSSREGVRSRDLTPANGGLLDADPVLGEEVSAREMRKIKALEKSYSDRKDHPSKVDKKQKKRNSGGSNMNTPMMNQFKTPGQPPMPFEAKQFSGSPPLRPFTDDGRGSASAPRSLKPVPPTYASIAIQTDPEPCEATPLSPFKKIRYTTPTQRLLKKILQDRNRSHKSSSPLSPSSERPPLLNEDTETKDVEPPMPPDGPSESRQPFTCPVSVGEGSSMADEGTYPLPSQAAHTMAVHDNFKTPAPRLTLSTLPPPLGYTNGSTTTIPSPQLATSVDITFSSFQSPLSASIPSAIQPSPAKKKLSLGDYMNRRNASATPVTEKSQAQAMEGMELDQDKSDLNGTDPSLVDDPLAGTGTGTGTALRQQNDLPVEQTQSQTDAENNISESLKQSATTSTVHSE